MRGDEIEWGNVKRVLVVKLRSIGDTVLATPSLIALKRFLPDAEIDILLEDWVAPLLDGFDEVDNVISVGTNLTDRLKVACKLCFSSRYDVVFDLHGGPTARFFTAVAARKKHTVGYLHPRGSGYFYALPPPAKFWKKEKLHSAEQQLALFGFVGVPVEDRPKSRLVVTPEALYQITLKLPSNLGDFALLHPTTAFFTKQWPVENFARTAEFLAEKSIGAVAISSKNESHVLDQLTTESKVPIITFDDLTLPEITALASKAKLFVGNDSGMAHIAAAVQTPTVVIFGSSNRAHWYPWTDAPNEIVYEEFPCQPCPGYECKEFGDPKCILSVKPEKVFAAIDRVLSASRGT